MRAGHGYIGLSTGPVYNRSPNRAMAGKNLVEKILHVLGITVESPCTIHFFFGQNMPSSHPSEQYQYIQNHEIVERVQLHSSMVTEFQKMKGGGRSRIFHRGVMSGSA